ncbi:MAG TPA: DUF1735 domain-containing protein [Chlamydiales bacterium]|nr:DUF1735 domain-containing protein [Chlamydiales bacterium]
MAVSAIAPSAVSQWITPQEQLQRLRDELHDYMVPPLKEGTSECLCPSLEDIVVEYAGDPNLINWYRALELIDALPDKIPPLPRGIVQILNSGCPIRSGDKKSDETTYKLTDTHSLYLIPPDSLTQFEARIRAYGARIYPYRKNPLRFERFWDMAHRRYGNVRPNTYEWVLISNDVLEGSIGESFVTQAKMVADLSRKAFASYEVPSLREFAMAMFLHKVATKESLLESKGYSAIFTRVQEAEYGHQLVISGPGSSGMHVNAEVLLDEDVGMAVLRRVGA